MRIHLVDYPWGMKRFTIGGSNFGVDKITFFISKKISRVEIFFAQLMVCLEQGLCLRKSGYEPT